LASGAAESLSCEVGKDFEGLIKISEVKNKEKNNCSEIKKVLN